MVDKSEIWKIHLLPEDLKMEKPKEFLENFAIEGLDRVSRLNFPPHRPHIDSSFYEYFVLRGIRVDRVQPGSITCSFKVPHRLTVRE